MDADRQARQMQTVASAFGMLPHEHRTYADDHGTGLAAYAWPGGYPVMYLDREDNSICAKCADSALDDFSDDPSAYVPLSYLPCAYFIHYEGAPIECSECGAAVESAYGECE